MNLTVSPENRYLSIDEVARRFGVSTDSIRRWANAGNFSRPGKVGPNTTRWRLREIVEHEYGMPNCFATAVFDLSDFVSRLAA